MSVWKIGHISRDSYKALPNLLILSSACVIYRRLTWMPPIGGLRRVCQEFERVPPPHFLPWVESLPSLPVSTCCSASVGPSQAALFMVIVGTGSQDRESSSALVPPSVLPGQNKTSLEPGKIHAAHIGLEWWCREREREGCVEVLMKERMRKQRPNK